MADVQFKHVLPEKDYNEVSFDFYVQDVETPASVDKLIQQLSHSLKKPTGIDWRRDGLKDVSLTDSEFLTFLDAAKKIVSKIAEYWELCDSDPIQAKKEDESLFRCRSESQLRHSESSALMIVLLFTRFSGPAPFLESALSVINHELDRPALMASFGIYQVERSLCAITKNDWKRAYALIADAGLAAAAANFFSPDAISVEHALSFSASDAANARHEPSRRVKKWAVENYSKFYKKSTSHTVDRMLKDAMKYCEVVGFTPQSDRALFNMIYKHLRKEINGGRLDNCPVRA